MIKSRLVIFVVFICFYCTAFSQEGTGSSDNGIHIDVYAGAIRNSFSTAIKGRYDSYQLEPAYSPSFGVNILYGLPANNQFLKFGFSIGYNGFSHSTPVNGSKYYENGIIHYTTVYTENIIVKNSLLTTNLYAMLVLNPKSKTQFYVKAGLNTNFALGSDKVVRSENSSVIDGMNGNTPLHYEASSNDQLAKYKQVYIALQTGAGVAIGRSKIEFCYWPSTNIVDDDLDRYSTMQKTLNMSSMGIFYYFQITH